MAYTALSIDSCEEYETVKSAIFKSYELVLEVYREKLRNYRKFVRQKHTSTDGA